MAVAWGRDTGILAKIRRTMVAVMKADPSPKLRLENKLEMSHLLPNFFILCFGFAISAVAFCFECLGKKCTSRARPGVRHHDEPQAEPICMTRTCLLYSLAIRLMGLSRTKQAWTREGVEHTDRHITHAHNTPES